MSVITGSASPKMEKTRPDKKWPPAWSMDGVNVTCNKNKPSLNPLNELNNLLSHVKILEYKKCHIEI